MSKVKNTYKYVYVATREVLWLAHGKQLTLEDDLKHDNAAWEAGLGRWSGHTYVYVRGQRSSEND